MVEQKNDSRDLLVGSTGFVGRNLSDAHDFSCGLHSTNVSDSFGKEWDLLVYTGVPSAMFLANKDPKADLEIMAQARKNIAAIAPKQLVLISTIAVYGDSRGKSELDDPDNGILSAYGKNRLQLERWVRSDRSDALIVRLPALYGRHLKKNFLYDLIHPAPAMLTEKKYKELSAASPLVRDSYKDIHNGFYAKDAHGCESDLEAWFAQNDFNSLAFTDSRSQFQFYDLSNLWNHIKFALEEDITLLNIATEPISAGEVYRYLYQKTWTNELSGSPFDYDMRSIHFPFKNDEPGYTQRKETILKSIASFVKREQAGR